MTRDNFLKEVEKFLYNLYTYEEEKNNHKQIPDVVEKIFRAYTKLVVNGYFDNITEIRPVKVNYPEPCPLWYTADGRMYRGLVFIAGYFYGLPVKNDDVKTIIQNLDVYAIDFYEKNMSNLRTYNLNVQLPSAVNVPLLGNILFKRQHTGSVIKENCCDKYWWYYKVETFGKAINFKDIVTKSTMYFSISGKPTLLKSVYYIADNEKLEWFKQFRQKYHKTPSAFVISIYNNGLYTIEAKQKDGTMVMLKQSLLGLEKNKEREEREI